MHKESCLLYASGELDAKPRAEFERHLASCPDCREWLEIIARGRRWAEKSGEPAPEKLVESTLRQASGSRGEAGKSDAGWKIPGWFSFLLNSALLTGAVYVGKTLLEKTSGPKDVPSSPVPVGQVAPFLETPRVAGRRPGPPAASTLPLSSPLPNQAGLPMPGRPLDCGDDQAILEFKRFVVHEFFNGISYAQEWSRCLCGERASKTESPKPPPPQDSYRALPSCPIAPSGALGSEALGQIEEEYIRVSKHFYEQLPLSQRQAFRLAECFCGPMPRAAQ